MCRSKGSPICSTTRSREAAQKAGHPAQRDYNGESQLGVGTCQVAQWRGIRQSEARAYLGSAWRRPNLKTRTGCEVQRILFEGNRAVGVEYVRKGKRVVEHADREVIISAGALSSPKLLMLSGVGPRDDIERFGITPVCDVPGVGSNLQEHPMCPMIFNVNVPTINMDLNVKSFVKHGWEYLLHGTGPASSGVCHVLLFLATRGRAIGRTSKPASLRSAWWAPMPVTSPRNSSTPPAITTSRTCSSWGDLPAPSSCRCCIRDHEDAWSSGRRTRPNRRRSVTSSSDRTTTSKELAEGIREVRRVFAAEPLARYVISEALPGPDISSDEEFEGFLRMAAWGAQHPVGTCKMGTDGDAVVDPQLRVRGVENLRVVDASVMPTSPSGNTNAATVLIAEKASDMILSAAQGYVDRSRIRSAIRLLRRASWRFSCGRTSKSCPARRREYIRGFGERWLPLSDEYDRDLYQMSGLLHA